ncbi:MAG: ATP-binding protein, partial [Candidatus Sericytochromatia bacterium]
FTYRDPATGRERVAVYRPIPTTGWALVSTHPRQHELLVVLSRTRLNSLLALSIALLVGLASIVWMSVRLARPVERLSARLEEPPDQRPLEQLASFAVLKSGVREYDEIARRMQGLRHQLREKTGTLEHRNVELNRVNEQLEEALAALRQLEKLRTDFINMIGHDLRIPLTSIIGFAELTEDLARDRCPDVLPYMAQITAACRTMTDQLEQLIDYARLRTGHLKLDREPIAPSEELQRVADFFTPLAQAKELTLTTETPPDLPLIMADRRRLEQILQNLLSNAVKYTQPGGKITLRGRTEGRDLVIEVEDTGIGLTDEDREHLFEQFFRSERPEVQAQSGAGLGLAGTKAMVEAHGGTIEAHGAAEGGSIFRVRLPLRPELT